MDGTAGFCLTVLQHLLVNVHVHASGVLGEERWVYIQNAIPPVPAEPRRKNAHEADQEDEFYAFCLQHFRHFAIELFPLFSLVTDEDSFNAVLAGPLQDVRFLAVTDDHFHRGAQIA